MSIHKLTTAKAL